MEERSDRFTAIEDRYVGYTVYDPDGDKIGKVDDLFVDENDQPEYIGVKMGLLGTRSTLIPWELVEVRDTESTLIVSVDDAHVKDGPTFDDDQDITPEFEGEASEAQIGEDEVSVPVTEEEVVVEKRPVAKEEVRIRKDVVEDTEVVEEDVRREEIDVEDATAPRRGA